MPGNELALIFLIFIAWLLRLGVLARSMGNRVEQEVFGFDITS